MLVCLCLLYNRYPNFNKNFLLVCNQMERGVLAIFGGISDKSAKAVQSFVNFHQIPFITWNNPSYRNNNLKDNEMDSDYEMDNFNEDDDNKDPIVFRKDQDFTQNVVDNKQADSLNETNYLINMHPDISSVLVSLIKYNRYKTIYYLYNHEAALNRLQELLDYQMKETDFLTNILARRI